MSLHSLFFLIICHFNHYPFTFSFEALAIEQTAKRAKEEQAASMAQVRNVRK